MSEEEPDPPEEQESQPESCCPIRRKVLVGILKVLSEDECGVSDSELADVIRFDLATPTGKPVLAFRFCPWCGHKREPGGETRITDIGFNDPDSGGTLEG